MAVLVQHRAAAAADAPAISGKRRTAAEQVAPAHPAVAIAHPGGRRLARRKFGKINGTGGSHEDAEQNNLGVHLSRMRVGRRQTRWGLPSLWGNVLTLTACADRMFWTLTSVSD